MSKVFIEEETLIGIGNAIREKNGTTDLIATTDMATAISNLPSGGGEIKYAQKKYTASSNYSRTFTFDLSDIIDISTPFIFYFTGFTQHSTSSNDAYYSVQYPMVLSYDGNGVFTNLLPTSSYPGSKFKTATLDENCILTITLSSDLYSGGYATVKTFYINIFYVE